MELLHGCESRSEYSDKIEACVQFKMVAAVATVSAVRRPPSPLILLTNFMTVSKALSSPSQTLLRHQQTLPCSKATVTWNSLEIRNINLWPQQLAQKQAPVILTVTDRETDLQTFCGYPVWQSFQN